MKENEEKQLLEKLIGSFWIFSNKSNWFTYSRSADSRRRGYSDCISSVDTAWALVEPRARVQIVKYNMPALRWIACRGDRFFWYLPESNHDALELTPETWPCVIKPILDLKSEFTKIIICSIFVLCEFFKLRNIVRNNKYRHKYNFLNSNKLGRYVDARLWRAVICPGV